MKDQELFKQLNSLSKMTPSADWKKSQRELMLRQLNISEENGTGSFAWKDFLDLPINFVQNISQASATLAVLAVVLLTGGIYGLKVAQDTKPGDSLYLAKIVGEKTQFALTLSERKKLELSLNFAANRASEIEKIISDSSNGEAIDDEQVEKLVQDFKNEIASAKSKIEKIANNNSQTENEVVGETEIAIDTEEFEIAQVEESDAEENVQVFSAGSSRDQQGIEISEQDSEEVEETDTEDESESLDDDSTTTPEIVEEQEAEESSASSRLEEAGDLLKSENYTEVYNILEEAQALVDKKLDKDGEVKGVSEEIVDEEVGEDVASSTEEE